MNRKNLPTVVIEVNQIKVDPQAETLPMSAIKPPMVATRITARPSTQLHPLEARALAGHRQVTARMPTLRKIKVAEIGIKPDPVSRRVVMPKLMPDKLSSSNLWILLMIVLMLAGTAIVSIAVNQ